VDNEVRESGASKIAVAGSLVINAFQGWGRLKVKYADCSEARLAMKLKRYGIEKMERAA
jgi:hypothetical protein